VYGRLPFQPGREKAIRLCLEWILRHQDADGVWGGIQPPWIYSLLALSVEGYPNSHPVMQAGIGAFDGHWSYEKDGARYLHASDSIVWDTALTLIALLDVGCRLSESPQMTKAVDWLLDQQVLAPGDWQETVRGAAPGGWAFERANRHYPDCDDTAVVLQVLARVRREYPDRKRLETAIERGRAWLLAMQCRNGGWAAFDRDHTHRLVTRIPFCDFGEVLDPPSVDVTAHVVETLHHLGEDSHSPALRKALRFLLAEQEPDGSWFGRWGVNHIYGTGAVLPALACFQEKEFVGDAVARGTAWLMRCQNPDGGWGESPASYMDPALRGRGTSTASQTSWALMGLLSQPCDRLAKEAIGRGLAFLARTQRAEGTWDEPEYTGTGFPGYGFGDRLIRSRKGKPLPQGTELERGFMINYNLYRHYFPIMAMARAGKGPSDVARG
jgi:squalene-hopene/tetraprenyl-beta-curcumene cyclase